MHSKGVILLLLLGLAALANCRSVESAEDTYGISDQIQKLKDRLKATKTFIKLSQIARDIRAKAGVARDIAVQKAVDIINSERVQDLINKIPKAWRQKFVEVVENLRKFGAAAADRLKALWSVTKEKTTALINAIKDDAEAAGITQKLREARDLIKENTLKAKEAGRAKLLDVLGSDGFEKAVSKLPEKVQKFVREHAESLRKSLQDGVEVPEAYALSTMDPALAIDIFAIIQDLTNLIQLIKKTGSDVGMDLIRHYTEIVESKEFKDLVSRLPESWQVRINGMVAKITEFIEKGGEMIENVKTQIRNKISDLVGILREKAVNAAIKLLEIKDLLKEKTSGVFGVIKRKLAALFNSQYFQIVVSMLPEDVQKVVLTIIKTLKSWLGLESPVEYGITDKWQEIKDAIAATKTFQEIMKLFHDMKKQAGVARDLAAVKIMDFINSDTVQGVINKIPESWRQKFTELVKTLREQAAVAAEHLKHLWVVTKERTSILIDAIKDDAEATGVAQKLRDARDLIQEKSLEAKEAGRAKLLDILGSDAFEKAVSKLPEKVQKHVREQAESLQKALQDGVEVPDSTFALDAERAATETLSWIDDWKKRIDLHHKVAVLRDITLLEVGRLVNGGAVKAMIKLIPKSMVKMVNKFIEDVTQKSSGAEKRLELVWQVTRERGARLVVFLKDDSSTAEIVKEIEEALDLIRLKALGAKKEGRRTLLRLLNSEDLKMALLKLPKESQKSALEHIEFLKKVLVEGVKPATNENGGTEKYAIGEWWKPLQDRLDAMDVIDYLKAMFDVIQKKTSVLRDIALQNFVKFIRSSFVQNLLSKLPPEFKEKMKLFIDGINKSASEAAAALRSLWKLTAERTSRIIDAMKDDAEAAGITQKLREARDLIKQELLDAKVKGRKQLLAILNSEAFEKAVSMLPEKAQKQLREQAESLRNALEKGVTTPGYSMSSALKELVSKLSWMGDLKKFWTNTIKPIITTILKHLKAGLDTLKEFWRTMRGVTHNLATKLETLAGRHGIVKKLLDLEKELRGSIEKVRMTAGAELQRLLDSRAFAVLMSSLPEAMRNQVIIHARTLQDLLGPSAGQALLEGGSTKVAYATGNEIIDSLDLIAEMIEAIQTLRDPSSPQRKLIAKTMHDLLQSDLYKKLVAKIPSSVRERLQKLEEEVRSLIEDVVGVAEDFWKAATAKVLSLKQNIGEFVDKHKVVRELFDKAEQLWDKTAVTREAGRKAVIGILDSFPYQIFLDFLPSHLQKLVRELSQELKQYLESHPVEQVAFVTGNEIIDAADLIAEIYEAIQTLRNPSSPQRKLIAKTMHALLESDLYKKLVAKVPPHVRERLQTLEAEVRSLIEDVVGEAEDFWEAVKAKVLSLKQNIGEFADKHKVVRELFDKAEQLWDKSAVTREAGRKAVIRILGSFPYQFFLDFLPSHLQKLVRELSQELKQYLESHPVEQASYMIPEKMDEGLDLTSPEFSIRIPFDVHRFLREVATLIKAITARVGILKDAAKRKLGVLLRSDRGQQMIAKLPSSMRTYMEDLSDRMEKDTRQTQESINVAYVDPSKVIKAADLIAEMIQAIQVLRNASSPQRKIIAKTMHALLESAAYKKLVSKVPPETREKILSLEREARSLVDSIVGKAKSFWEKAKEKVRALKEKIVGFAESHKIVREFMENAERLWHKTDNEREAGRKALIKVLGSVPYEVFLYVLPPHLHTLVRQLSEELKGHLESHPVVQASFLAIGA